MDATYAVRPLAPPPWTEVEPLIHESEGEGYRFLARLRDEYEAGSNRFDRAGERLLGVWSGPALVAVGGVNVDPYAGDPRVGRLRHLYVARAHRGRGVGRLLVRALVDAAGDRFDALTLRTATEDATRFYEALGFAPVSNPHHTHRLALPTEAGRSPGRWRRSGPGDGAASPPSTDSS